MCNLWFSFSVPSYLSAAILSNQKSASSKTSQPAQTQPYKMQSPWFHCNVNQDILVLLNIASRPSVPPTKLQPWTPSGGRLWRYFIVPDFICHLPLLWCFNCDFSPIFSTIEQSDIFFSVIYAVMHFSCTSKLNYTTCDYYFIFVLVAISCTVLLSSNISRTWTFNWVTTWCKIFHVRHFCYVPLLFLHLLVHTSLPCVLRPVT